MAEFPNNWMWSEACEMLARAERLHRQLFQPLASAQCPGWEPPVDVIETERDVLVLVALPGVAPDQVVVSVEGADLMVTGSRTLPPQLRNAVIHRLELPQGQFARRVRLPAGRYDGIRRSEAYGCLVITLAKTGIKTGTSRG
jgi:HSP20 family molecular chaperone IbpA